MLLRSVRFFSLPCTGVKPPGLMASSGKHNPSAKAADRATIPPAPSEQRMRTSSLQHFFCPICLKSGRFKSRASESRLVALSAKKILHR